MSDNYSVVIQWSPEDGEYVGSVPELVGVSAVGANREEVAREIANAIEACTSSMKDERRELPLPRVLDEHSGQLRVRLPKSLHARLAALAEMDGVSLNTFIVSCLSHAAGGITARRRAVYEPAPRGSSYVQVNSVLRADLSRVFERQGQFAAFAMNASGMFEASPGTPTASLFLRDVGRTDGDDHA